MARPWEEGLPEGVSRLSRIFNDPNEKMARLGQGCMYDPPSRPSSASPRGRPQSASPRYYGAQPASPRQQERPGSAHIGGRPQSPRTESPRGSLQQSYGQAPGASPRASPRTQGQSYGARATQGQGRARPQSAAAPASPRMRELEETNDALRRSYRLAQLEQENDGLRSQLEQLKAARAYDPSNPMVKYSPRRAHRRANLPITGGMGHEQMVREAKLRAAHNRQRAQLKGAMHGDVVEMWATCSLTPTSTPTATPARALALTLTPTLTRLHPWCGGRRRLRRSPGPRAGCAARQDGGARRHLLPAQGGPLAQGARGEAPRTLALTPDP